MKKWDTIRIAFYGAFVGCLYGAYANGPYWNGNTGDVLEAMGGVVGGGIGAAAIAAAVSGIRNLLIR